MARTADPGAVCPAIAARSAIAGRRVPAAPGAMVAWRVPAACAALAVAVLGCASPPAPLPIIAVPVSARIQLASLEGGPAVRLATRVTITTMEALPVEVVGVRDDVVVPEEASLLDLDVTWTDFEGLEPRSLGHSERFVLPFVKAGVTVTGAPLVVESSVPLPPAPGVLARRVVVHARIIGIDLRQEHGHTGGTLLPLPEVTLDSLAEVPPGTLAQHLQSRSLPGIFLSAASAPAERREQTLAALIEALPATPEPARGAIFAALLYLTGETHGRDIYRWSTWWKARAATIDRTPPGPLLPAMPGPPAAGSSAPGS